MKGEEGKGERGGPRVSFFAEDFRRNKDRRVKEKACRAKSLFLSLSPSLTFFLRDCAARKTSNYRAKFQSALNNLRWPLRGGRNSCCVDAVSIREGRRARVERSLLGPCLRVCTADVFRLALLLRDFDDNRCNWWKNLLAVRR